jgi:hypothetical protein
MSGNQRETLQASLMDQISGCFAAEKTYTSFFGLLPPDSMKTSNALSKNNGSYNECQGILSRVKRTLIERFCFTIFVLKKQFVCYKKQ